MENGEQVTTSIAAELEIPDGPREREREAARAPARFAFWAYQTERALAALRLAERRVEEAEAVEYQMARSWIAEHTTVEVPTEANVRTRMLLVQSGPLKTLKDSLAEAQVRYGVLRALRDASEHRSHALRRLTAQHNESG